MNHVGVAMGSALFLAAVPASPGALFVDVTDEVGIDFVHERGASGRKYLPETIGSGVLILDYDGDLDPDLLFVNSTALPGSSDRGLPALYQNDGEGGFRDVAEAAGLRASLYGIGGSAADFDNDGDADVYLTAWGPNRLLRNDGGRFVDVSKSAGVADPGFSTSAAWFDYDADGLLDLFVANYVEWSPEKDLHCTLDGQTKSYCTPESYPGQSPTLYRNKGDGSFENVTQAAGLHDPASKALGVALFDHDADGHLDVFVANDTQPDKLYRSRGDGTFEDVATVTGVAYSETGKARAGMGVDAADYDRSGFASLIVGNFSNEMMALFHNEGGGLFLDEAPVSALGRASLPTLTFGCFFFDYDLDGWLDIFAANGHVADDIQSVQPGVSYAQPPHLFRNLAGSGFEDVAPSGGPALQKPFVGRGAAYADLDGDGDLDLVVTENGGSARVLRNQAGASAGSLRVRLEGVESNRDAIGARVTVRGVDGSTQWLTVRTGSSYASQSELTLTFGLGSARRVDRLEVEWPSGKKDAVSSLRANRTLTIREGQGLVDRTLYER